MKFAHLGDTHIGKREKLKDRVKDFEDAFERAIDGIIDTGVDFVIHSGDLFDTGKPEIESILLCMEQLGRLKKEGIQFYVVKGSHDVGFGETKTIIDLLEQAGLVINLSDKRYVKDNKLFCEENGDVCIYGVWGKKSGIVDFYQNTKIEPMEGKFNVFVFHQAVSSIRESEMFADIETNLLPKGFDYYASGHWHGKEELSYNGKPLIYPGSIENCNVDEMIRNDKKGFYVVDTQNGKYEFVPIIHRRVKIIKVESKNDTAETLTNKIIELMETQKDSKPLLVIILRGELDDKRSKIDKGYLSKTASERGYLSASVSLAKLKEKQEEKIEVKKTNIKDIEEEYLSAKGYEKDEIEFAREIMELIGKKLTPSELEKESEKVKKIIEMRIK